MGTEHPPDRRTKVKAMQFYSYSDDSSREGEARGDINKAGTGDVRSAKHYPGFRIWGGSVVRFSKSLLCT